MNTKSFHQLPLSLNTRSNQLKVFYQALSKLREAFHSSGRFDDANSKLDEISKLLVIKLNEEKRKFDGKTYRFTIEKLGEIANKLFDDSEQIAKALHWLFNDIIEKEEYKNPDGTSIFGSYPTLNIQQTENRFAKIVIELINSINLISTENDLIQTQLQNRFDVLNEAFGHFVRDSFRNTKEDAQYMTPEEVINTMVDIALYDISKDPEDYKRILNCSAKRPFIILDPTCGVGSFLVAIMRKIINIIDQGIKDKSKSKKLKKIFKEYCIYGQDKIDRMVRLATLNLLFLGIDKPHIKQGNSIIGTSILDDLEGKVDLILTNPPFGAEFLIDEILKENGINHYPMVNELFGNNEHRNGKTIDSEIILLDRCLQLLKPKGRLLIILPDNISSGKSKFEKIRQWIQSRAIIRAVIQLPSITFAQAGTRTKTNIVYLQKLDREKKLKNSYIFMSVCEDIGYKVVERTGAPVKKIIGENQLVKIVDFYKDKNKKPKNDFEQFSIVDYHPSVAWIREDSLLNGRWIPNFYQPKRLKAIKFIQGLPSNLFKAILLREIVSFETKQRKTIPVSKTVKCISVLHVDEDGTIDLSSVIKYNPKWPGIECIESDILFSKINPRIQRICVIPKSPYQLTCSSEFEIMRINKESNISPYILSAFLRHPLVYEQIICLTSGTSSSHNRIKDSELKEVILPIPKKIYEEDHSKEDIERILRLIMQIRYETIELKKILEKLLEETLNNKSDFSMIIPNLTKIIAGSNINKSAKKILKEVLNKHASIKDQT